MSKKKKLFSRLLREAADELDRPREVWNPALEKHAVRILECIREGIEVTQPGLDGARRAIPHVLAEFDDSGHRSMRHLRTPLVAREMYEWGADEPEGSCVAEIESTIRSLKKILKRIRGDRP